MKTRSILYSLLLASAAVMLLAGCIKMPKPGNTGPNKPEMPAPPLQNISIRSGMSPAM